MIRRGKTNGQRLTANGKGVWAFGLVLFIANALMVSPYVGWQDSGEFLATTTCLGVSHPGGQPLYHLLGRLFLLLPLGSPAWRLGLMSAAAAAAASMLLYALARRLTDLPSPWIALGVAAWSLSLPWWTQAATVETYSLGLLHAFFVLWALTQEGRKGWILTGLALGLAVAHRPTFLFGAVALPFLWTGTVPAGRVKKLLFFIFAFLVGSRLPFVLALRSALNPSVSYADLSQAAPLFRHILGLDYSSHVGVVSFDGVARMVLQVLKMEAREMAVVGLLLACVGLVRVFPQWRSLPVFFKVALLWALADFALVLTVPYPTVESHQILWPLAVDGLLALYALAWINGKWIKGIRRRETMAAVALGLWVLVQAMNGVALWKKRNNSAAEDYARNLLAVMERSAVYFPSEDNDYFPVIGYQQGYGYRKDVTVVSPGALGRSGEQKLTQALYKGGPVYVAKLAPGLPKQWVPIPVGPVWKIAREPAWVKGGEVRGVPVGAWKGLQCVGVKVTGLFRPGGIATLEYGWRRTPGFQLPDRLQADVLFTDEKGQYPLTDGHLWFHDVHDLLNGWISPREMEPGRVYTYRRTVFIPSGFPVGLYKVLVGIEEPALPKQGKMTAGGEFYGSKDWQASWRTTGRGNWSSTLMLDPVSGTSPDRLWAMFPGKENKSLAYPTTRKKPRLVLGPPPRFAHVGGLDIKPKE